MGKNQVSVSTVTNKQALEKAREVFSQDHTDAELINRMIEGWYQDRLTGGKNKKLDLVLQEIERLSCDVLESKVKIGQVEAMIAALLKTVSIDHSRKPDESQSLQV